MMRYSVRIALIAALIGICAGACLAGSSIPIPAASGSAPFQMQQGWWNGYEVWYISTDTSNVSWAGQYRLTLAPLLGSVTAPKMWVVLNPPATQGPIFQAVPGIAAYAGVVDVVTITWNPGYVKIPIISASQIATLIGESVLRAVDTRIVVDNPIVAVGPLGGPWLPQPPGAYRIRQGTVLPNYVSTKDDLSADIRGCL